MTRTSNFEEPKTPRFPVGFIMMTMDSNNPEEYLGYGTWERWGKGRVPVGVDEGDPLFPPNKSDGGTKDAVVVNHTHTHTDYYLTVLQNTAWKVEGWGINGAGERTLTTSGASNGTDGAGKNLQPYITCYMWRRTA